MRSRLFAVLSRTFLLILIGATYTLSLTNTQAQGPILTVKLLDRTYDVYNIAPQLIEIRALNNRRPSDESSALALGEFTSTDIYKHAAWYSPHGGLWYLHTNVNISMDTFAEDGGAGDVGIIGWDRFAGDGARAFIYDPTNRVRYLTNLYPQIQALDQSLGGNKLKGMRINRRGEMLLLSQGDNSNPTTFYKVSTNGTATPLPGPVNGAGLLDINNHGQLPPMGDDDDVNSAINDIGDYAGFVIDLNSTNTVQKVSLYATRNGQELPNSSGARPTSINNLGYIAASPGIIWGPDDTRTYLPEAMVAQDTNHVLTRFQNYTNNSYPTFINDAKDIVVGGYYLEPVCPEVDIGTTGATGFEIIDGKFAVRVGNRFKVTAVIYNGPKVSLRNVTVGIEPATHLFRQVGASTPPVPTTLQPNQTASSEFEWEVVESGTYTGRFVLHASGDCGPVVQPVFAPSVISFVKPQLGAQIEAAPWTVGISNAVEVHITAKNNTTNLMTNVHLSAPLTVTGNGGVALTNGPLPVSYASLNAGNSVVFTNYYFTTNLGRVTLKGTLLAQMNGNSITSNPAASPSISIQSKGDLLIKRSGESDSAYAIDNEYQANPVGKQVRTNTVSLKEQSEFQVRIQNDEPIPKTFVLKIREETDPGWKLKYLFDGSDITTTLRATGVTFPQLASNATHTVTVQMTPTNALADDPMRVLLQLEDSTSPGEVIDIVEAVTAIASDIIVNSTGDEPDADPNDLFPDVDLDKTGLQTTLRCAIDFANRRAGADKIKFDIKPEDNLFEDGVPTILPHSALPDIIETLIVDGWSQSTNSLSPPIQLRGLWVQRPGGYSDLSNSKNSTLAERILDWPGAASGLHVQAERCEIRGLVINHFPLCGILVDGSGTVIQGNYLGTDPSGNIARANGMAGFDWIIPEPSLLSHRGTQVALRSRGNLVGGAGIRERNVISGREGTFSQHIGAFTPGTPAASVQQILGVYTSPLILVTGSSNSGNRVSGNIIGLTASGAGLPGVDGINVQKRPADGMPSFGILVSEAPDTVIGGSSPGEGNIIAGNLLDIGVLADGCFVEGNKIGADAGLTRTFQLIGHDSQSPQGISINGNPSVVGGSQPASGNTVLAGGITVEACTNAIVQNNWVGITPAGQTFSGGLEGITVVQTMNALIRSNVVSDRLSGIVLLSDRSTRITGNRIFENRRAGIEIQGSEDGRLDLNLITTNGIQNKGAGVLLPALTESGRRMVITSNSMTGNHLGISFGHQLVQSYSDYIPTPNDVGDSDDGPNSRLNYPQINEVSQTLGNGPLKIKGGFGSILGSHIYRIDFYHSQSVAPSGYANAENFLRFDMIQTDFSGQAVFNLTNNVGQDLVGQYLSATTTDAEGNTSEFSVPILVQGNLDFDGDAMSDAVETKSPGLSPGDGNRDGIPDAQQSRVTSFPAANGQWLTLVTHPTVLLTGINPSAIPQSVAPPAGYVFPVGVISLTLSNVAPGGTVLLTNILHDIYTITSVLVYGPTPGNTQPHWHELTPVQSGQEVRLSLTDGTAGDNDLATNGSITTIFALAYRLPPPPKLTLLRNSPSVVERVSVNPAFTNTLVLITNRTTDVTSVLAYPTDGNSYVLEFTDALSPASPWLPVLHEWAAVGGQLVITNTSSSPMGFYRLRPGKPITLSQVGSPTLTIQRTSTNTILLSWPATFTGFVLQQNTNIATGNWTTTTNAATATNGLNQVILPPATGSRFFRLTSF